MEDKDRLEVPNGETDTSTQNVKEPSQADLDKDRADNPDTSTDKKDDPEYNAG